ncbi:MAG: sulfite exporter TauE/SafE family protein [Pseudomonadota bacterium]
MDLPLEMPLDLIALHAAAVIAAFFQSVTGIGFGMIAGPVILIVLNDPAGVMISTLMSWLVAVALFPILWRGANGAMVRRLALAACAGVIPGALLLGYADISVLKLFAALAITGLTLMILFGLPGVNRPGPGRDAIFGAFGGFFGGALAMPGPPAALRASALGWDKRTVRATMVCFFVAVWPIVFAAQAISIGLPRDTLWNALSLVPATLAGLAIGNWAAARVSEAFFRRLVFGVLFAAAAALMLSVLRDWMGAGA